MVEDSDFFFQLFQPHYQEYTCLLIQLFAMDFKYKATKNHKSPGTIVNSHGNPPEIDIDDKLGWVIMPIFEK